MKDTLRVGNIVQFKPNVWLCVANTEPSLEGLRAEVDTVEQDHVWFRLLRFTGSQAEAELIDDLNGCGTNGPLFVVNDESPLSVLGHPDSDWRDSLDEAYHYVCKCGQVIGENDPGRFVVANEEEGVAVRLCGDCLAFDCEACGETVSEAAHACDRCSAPVCGACFETNHNCCAAVRS